LLPLIAVITLAYTFTKGALSTENRITKLETKIDLFWEHMRQIVGSALSGIKPKGNPISPERWQYLINKLQMNTLGTAEAQELNAAMIEQQEEAQKKNDQSTLLILGLGLALLAILLSSTNK
jgi:hypothetical protein